MPIHILASTVLEGPQVIPGWDYIKSYGPLVVSAISLKYYFAGATNTWDKNLHGQVYVVTGGTSGLGASIVDELASRGAQVVLLVRNIHDGWLVDHVENLREKHGNLLIYAEECDLNSLLSVRNFATSWLNNQTPRRIDGLILCAGESLPLGKPRELSADGVEKQTAINYLANFHLLHLMAPAIRSQPSDRRVKILVASCMSHIFAQVDLDDLLWENRRYPSNKPWKVFGTSKLLLACAVKEYQRRLDSYERSDKTQMSVRANMVIPGMMRSPSTKRFLSLGSLLGLFLYVLMYPILWLFLKSTYQGAQSFFYALMNPELETVPGGNFIQECSIVEKRLKFLDDPEFQKNLYDKTEKLILDLEKESARKANKGKKKDKSKKAKAKAEKKPEPTPEDEKNKLSFLRQQKLQEELLKMDKELPLFGDNAGKNTLVKENKYLKDLDRRFEERQKVLKKAN